MNSSFHCKRSRKHLFYKKKGLFCNTLTAFTAAKTSGLRHDPWGLNDKNECWCDDVSTHHQRVFERLTFIDWGKKWCCVAIRKSLILNLSLHFFSFFKTAEVRFRILVISFMSSIMINSMLIMSVRPLSAEKIFCSRIDSTMLAMLCCQPSLNLKH